VTGTTGRPVDTSNLIHAVEGVFNHPRKGHGNIQVEMKIWESFSQIRQKIKIVLQLNWRKGARIQVKGEKHLSELKAG